MPPRRQQRQSSTDLNSYRRRHRQINASRQRNTRPSSSVHREQRQLPAGRKLYLDDVSPGYTARMDSTLPYQRQAEEAGNRAYERAASNASTHRERTRIRHQQISYNNQLARRTRQNSTGVIPSRREQRAMQQADRETRQWQQAIENLTPDAPIVVPRQDQLWDKDKVDLARTQQAFYRDAAANIGVNWGNNLNPYTQQNLIQNAAQSFGMSNLASYTYPALGPMAGNIGTFIAEGIAGELGGLVGSQVLPTVWDNKYAPLVGGIVGGVLGGGIGNKLGSAWTNPNSLWSRNIRTEFANRKVPIGYNLVDKNNILPYITGTYNTLFGRRVPLKDRLDLAVDKYGILPRMPGQSVEDYVNTRLVPGSEEQYEFIRHYNRQGAFRHYLGVGDDVDNLRMLTNDGTLKSYYRNDDGTYGFPFNASDEQRFIDLSKVDNNNIKANNNTGFVSEAPLLTYDIALQNHGNVGGKLHYVGNDIVMDILDPWDLHPSSSLYEMSHYLPAGAKPFTLKHTIPISKNYSGLNKSGYRYDLLNIPTILGAFKRGDIIAPTTTLKIFD